MVIIDAGHGGDDYGGGSNESFKEKDLTLKISKYQYRRLKELGVDVVLTRDSDITLNPRDRINKINSYGSNNIVISNHINKALGQFYGAEVIYSFRQSPRLAELISTELKNSGRNINRVFTRKNKNGNDYYYVIRESLPNTTVLVEYGFADNPKDSVELQNNYEVYAEAVVKAICIYLGVPYKENNKYYYYTVKNGDSLYKISNKTGLTIKEIKEYNGLSSDKLKVNQVLKIPSRMIRSILYYAKENESLRDISNKYDIPIETIKKENNEIGDVIKIPLRYPLYPYVVKPGDSLYKIAINNNISLYQLINLNHLDNKSINPGDIIYIYNTDEHII